MSATSTPISAATSLSSSVASTLSGVAFTVDGAAMLSAIAAGSTAVSAAGAVGRLGLKVRRKPPKHLENKLVLRDRSINIIEPIREILKLLAICCHGRVSLDGSILRPFGRIENNFKNGK
ncbi:unnamed protein product [Cuscuta campestris]|uniref:Uncharacterized protein n=1 Tax=Cuscuta campestris TaxID=132261 RepID=A0A484MRQ6_9ASTE|nr:unnamed protein product [Cuscuta campestris]